jgi:hypothetical protein
MKEIGGWKAGKGIEGLEGVDWSWVVVFEREERERREIEESRY